MGRIKYWGSTCEATTTRHTTAAGGEAKAEMDVHDIGLEINVVVEEALASESEVIKSLRRATAEFDSEQESYDDDELDAMEQLAD